MISRYDVFIHVVNKRSFTLAAQELGYSQSAVSQNVAALEEELQTKLLLRKKDGLYLSEDGKKYLPYIEAIVNAQRALFDKKKEMDGFVDEIIQIGAFTSVSRNVLPHLMSQFKKIYPSVHFELRQGDYDEIYHWVNSGSVDFGFINPVGFEDIESKVIYEDTMVAVLPKNHPLASKESISLKELEKETFILLDEGKNSVPLQAFDRLGITPKIEYKIYDDYSILAMVKQGIGVSILYRLVATGYSDGIILKPIKEPIERKIAIAYHKKEMMTKASLAFMNYTLEHMEDVLKQIGVL